MIQMLYNEINIFLRKIRYFTICCCCYKCCRYDINNKLYRLQLYHILVEGIKRAIDMRYIIAQCIKLYTFDRSKFFNSQMLFTIRHRVVTV